MRRRLLSWILLAAAIALGLATGPPIPAQVHDTAVSKEAKVKLRNLSEEEKAARKRKSKEEAGQAAPDRKSDEQKSKSAGKAAGEPSVDPKRLGKTKCPPGETVNKSRLGGCI